MKVAAGTLGALAVIGLIMLAIAGLTGALAILLTAVALVVMIVLGGTLRHRSQAVIGSLAEDTVRRIRADKVFLGADGVVVGEGLNSPTEAQAHWKSVIIGQADQVYVAVDHSKLGVRRFAYLTPIDRDYTLITDWAATPSQLQGFVKQGIPVLRSDAPM